MFSVRSEKLERIDTGDYTPEEYDRFLEEVRFVNRYVGDNRALRKSLLKKIGIGSTRLKVLDVGAGSGELLRTIAEHTNKEDIEISLVGLDFNPRSVHSILEESTGYNEIQAVQGDALSLPFKTDSFDYVISSLFTHHLTTDQIVQSLSEMRRVATRGLFVIDLHRHPLAYVFYKAMCSVFGISELVRHDGSLSILKGFKPNELRDLGLAAGVESASVKRSFPFRLVLSGNTNLTPVNGKGAV